LVSTILGPDSSAWWRRLVLLGLTVLLAGCSSKQVIVEGNFPEPLLDPLPITMGVIYPPAFAQHEFFDEAKGRADSDWLVKTGEAQVAFWDILLGGLFQEVVHIDSWETVESEGGRIDGVLIPSIAELQYTVPTHTNVKVYEIWMRYEFRLADMAAIHQQADGALSFNPEDRLAQWPITAYGKTPTAFLQSDEEAVNLAAVVALRDAGAHFITTFGRTPEVAAWLDGLSPRQASGETVSNEPASAISNPTAGTASGTGADETREQAALQDSASMSAPNSADAATLSDLREGGNAVAEQAVSAVPLDSAAAAPETAGSSALGGTR
jgi:hypothetical protein